MLLDKQPVVGTMYFRVVDLRSRSHEPVLVRHHATEDDASLRAPLSFLLQYLEQWKPSSSITVFEDSDPEWVTADALAPWPVVAHHLMHLDSEMSDYECCFDLVNPVRVNTTFAIMDMSCPSFLVFSALRRIGWEPVGHRVTHTADGKMEMDGRVHTSRKKYYQTLLHLERCLKLSPTVPSDEPISFYHLLLNDIATVPGLSDKEYKRLANDNKLSKNSLVAIEDGVDVSALADMLGDGSESDDDIIAVGGGRVVPKAITDARRPAAPAFPVRPRVTVGGASGSGAASAPPAVALAPVGGPVTGDGSDVATSGSSSTSSSSSGDSSPDSAIVVGGARKKYTWYNLPGGGKMRVDEYVQRRKKRGRYTRWILCCPHHKKCVKKRSVSKATTARHGPLEPIGFLMAWRDLDAADQASHKAARVKRGDVKTWLDDNRYFARDNSIPVVIPS